MDGAVWSRVLQYVTHLAGALAAGAAVCLRVRGVFAEKGTDVVPPSTEREQNALLIPDVNLFPRKPSGAEGTRGGAFAVVGM